MHVQVPTENKCDTKNSFYEELDVHSMNSQSTK